MKWVTRKNARIDRVASSWLIKRFVDPDAEFLFVDGPAVLSTAEAEGAKAYDVAGADYADVDGRCTFEDILSKHNLDDPALAMMARIVRGADNADSIKPVPGESAGLAAIVHGFAELTGDDDETKIEHEHPMHDALFRWCQMRLAQG